MGLPPLEKIATDYGFVYQLPKKDTKKNKFIITGFVIDVNQIPLSDVSIKFGLTIVATTDADGFYLAAVNKRLLKEPLKLTVYKPEYSVFEPIINSEGKEVYELIMILTKK